MRMKDHGQPTVCIDPVVRCNSKEQLPKFPQPTSWLKEGKSKQKDLKKMRIP